MSNVTVSWPLATTRVGGAVLPAAQIALTKVYFSQGGGAYNFFGSRTPAEAQSMLITSVTPGTYGFKFSTVDTNDQEGPLSAAVPLVIGAPLPALPSPPDVSGVVIVVS